MLLKEAKQILKNNGYLIENVNDIINQILDNYNDETLEELKKHLTKNGIEIKNISFNKQYNVIYIDTDEYELVGYYTTDDETGECFLNLQDVNFHKELEDDFYENDPIYGKKANM